jgi:hypothetical protein
MAISDIKEIRLLPSLAIARFGSSPEPMDNYDVVLPPHDPATGQDGTGFRNLVPAPTLTVVDGRITQESTPDRARPTHDKMLGFSTARQRTAQGGGSPIVERGQAGHRLIVEEALEAEARDDYGYRSPKLNNINGASSHAFARYVLVLRVCFYVYN